MTYWSKFGTLGNDRHLPSVETCGSRFVAGMLFVPAKAVSYVAFIKSNIRDAMGKIVVIKNNVNAL